MTSDHSVETPGGAPAPLPSRFRERIGRLDPVLLATIGVGTVVRSWRLGAQSFWFDEWLTTEAVSGGLHDLYNHVANREGIPLPFFVLMWAWAHIFGDGETALRSVSVLAGIATIPVAYAIAREFRQRRAVARIAAILVAVNPMLVWYSQEARPYSLLAFFGALSTLTFARVWNRGRRLDFIVWGLVCAGALATHYYAAFLVATELGALVLRRRRQWRSVLLAVVPSLAIIAVLAPIAADQFSHSPNHRWISSWALGYRLREAGRAALAGPGSPRDWLWLVAAGFAALAGVLVVMRSSRAERSAAAILAVVGGTAVVLPLVAAVIGFDIFLSRYLIGALVPLLVAAAVGFGARRGAWVGGTAVVVLGAVWLTVVVAVARDPDLQKADWRAVAEVFESGRGSRAIVMNFHAYTGNPLRYYDQGVRSLDDGGMARVEEIDLLVYNATPKPCDFLVGRACTLLFLGATPLRASLASKFALADTRELEQFTVKRYRAAQPVPVTKAELVAPSDPAQAFVLVLGR